MPRASSRGARRTRVVRRGLGVLGVEQQVTGCGRWGLPMARAKRSKAASSESCACIRSAPWSPTAASRTDGRPPRWRWRRSRRVRGARGQRSGLGACARRSPKSTSQAARRGGGDRPVLRREDAARRLAGDHRLQVHQVEQAALHQLRLGERRDDAQKGLLGKAEGALGRASTSPVKHSVESRSTNSREKRPQSRSQSSSFEEKLRFPRNSRTCSRPAAIRKPRCGGRRRTKNSKTAVSSMPW